MAVSPLTGIGISLRNQISRELYDYAYSYQAFASILMSLDNMYKTTSRFTKSEDVAGSEMQVEFRASLPVVEGASPVTGSLAGLHLSPQSNFSVIGGKLPWSHYQLREDIRKAYIEHIDKDPKSVVPYLKEISQGARDAIVLKLTEHMFPSAEVTTSTTNYAQENQIQAVAYPLLDPASGVYEYMSIDMNAAGYTGLKATVKDSLGVPSLSNLRKNLLLPLRQKMAKLDVALVDNTIYDYMITQAESRVVIEQNTELNYGGEYVRYAGLYWVPEGRMDLLSADRELYLLDSSTWEFRQKGISTDMQVVQNPDTAWLMTMLGSFTCSLICKLPRKNGRAMGVTTS